MATYQASPNPSSHLLTLIQSLLSHHHLLSLLLILWFTFSPSSHIPSFPSTKHIWASHVKCGLHTLSFSNHSNILQSMQIFRCKMVELWIIYIYRQTSFIQLASWFPWKRRESLGTLQQLVFLVVTCLSLFIRVVLYRHCYTRSKSTFVVAGNEGYIHLEKGGEDS